jgi:hypothetical protein
MGIAAHSPPQEKRIVPSQASQHDVDAAGADHPQQPAVAIPSVRPPHIILEEVGCRRRPVCDLGELGEGLRHRCALSRWRMPLPERRSRTPLPGKCSRNG